MLQRPWQLTFQCWGHNFLFCRPSLIKFFCWNLHQFVIFSLVSATNKSITSLYSFFQTSALFSILIPFLRLSFFSHCLGHPAAINYLFSLSPLLSGYSGYPVTQFFLAMICANKVYPNKVYPNKFTQTTCAASATYRSSETISLTSGLHSSLLSDKKRTVPSKFSSTQVPVVSTKELAFVSSRLLSSLSPLLKQTQFHFKLLFL